MTCHYYLFHFPSKHQLMGLNCEFDHALWQDQVSKMTNITNLYAAFCDHLHAYYDFSEVDGYDIPPNTTIKVIVIEQRKKCLVKACPNHSDEGQFIGDLCSPCHIALRDGAWFNQDILQTILKYLDDGRLDLLRGYIGLWIEEA